MSPLTILYLFGTSDTLPVGGLTGLVNALEPWGGRGPPVRRDVGVGQGHLGGGYPPPSSHL